jgi:type I restriction enzyme, S subunit
VSASVGWPRVPLSEAYWFQEGPGVRKWQFTTSGIKLLNVGNIEKDGTLNLSKTERCLDESEVIKKYSHFLVDAGDLVIASSGISFDDDGLLRTRGAFVEKSDLPLCLNTSTIRFKAIENVSDLRFLRIWLNGREFRSQITKLVTGTAQQNFGPSHLKATKIALPTLAEQRRIADVLDRAEAMRAKRRAALAQLEILTQSIFRELFGDIVKNPRGWPIRSLGEVARGKPNNGIFRKNPDYLQDGADGLPVVWVEELFRGSHIDIKESRRVRPTSAEVENYGLKHGDILFCRSSLKLDGIAFNNVYLGPDNGALFECHLIRVQPELSIISPIYLNCLLRLPQMRAIAKSKSKTATMTTIDQTSLCSIPVMLPPLALQRKFERHVAEVATMKCRYDISLAKMDALFAVLQFHAFSGGL